MVGIVIGIVGLLFALANFVLAADGGSEHQIAGLLGLVVMCLGVVIHRIDKLMKDRGV